MTLLSMKIPLQQYYITSIASLFDIFRKQFPLTSPFGDQMMRDNNTDTHFCKYAASCKRHLR